MEIERGARRPKYRRKIFWYVRIGTYVAFLIVAFYFVTNLRDRIPMMFGITPVRIDPLTVRSAPRSGGIDSTDVTVTVRIVGRDSIAGGLRLAQFRLRSASDREFMANGSSFLFDRARGLAVAKGDTLIGAFSFALPANEKPEQLWWHP